MYGINPFVYIIIYLYLRKLLDGLGCFSYLCLSTSEFSVITVLQLKFLKKDNFMPTFYKEFLMMGIQP